MKAPELEIKQIPIVLGQKGEITIPQVIQDSLNINEGDNLILLQIGDLIVLTPQQPQVPQLIDQIATLMENENVSLTDLLAGLEAEREVINREQRSWCVEYLHVDRLLSLNTKDFTAEVSFQSGLIIQTPAEFIREIREIVEKGLLKI